LRHVFIPCVSLASPFVQGGPNASANLQRHSVRRYSPLVRSTCPGPGFVEPDDDLAEGHRRDGNTRIGMPTVSGVLSAPLKFTTGLIPGVGVGAAFPFVGRALRIDPLRRLSAAKIVDGPVGETGRAAKRGGKSLGRKLRKALPF
jgi:hypothetical protein